MQIRRILFAIIIIQIGVSSCFSEPKHKIEGLTEEIYREYSGLWIPEKSIKKYRIIGRTASWGEAYGQEGFGLLIDLESETNYEIWPDMAPLAVKKVEMIGVKTIRLVVDQEDIYYQTKDGKYHPLVDIPITMHLLADHRMWINSKVSKAKGGGHLLYDGPENIYKKVSGPDVKPMFTRPSDEKEFLTPP